MKLGPSSLVVLALLVFLLAPIGAAAAPARLHQSPPTTAPSVVAEAQRLYQSGKDQDVIRIVNQSSVQGETRAQLLYMAGQSHQRLRQETQARQAYAQLAARPESDPWRFVGQSAVSVSERRYDAALVAATRATTMSPRLPQAHYQLGVAQAFKQNYNGAASSFVQATVLDPSFAYAHYNAGLTYQRLRRVDLVARHLEAFLRLAPQAPERPMVESVLRTIRGRGNPPRIARN